MQIQPSRLDRLFGCWHVFQASMPVTYHQKVRTPRVHVTKELFKLLASSQSRSARLWLVTVAVLRQFRERVRNDVIIMLADVRRQKTKPFKKHKKQQHTEITMCPVHELETPNRMVHRASRKQNLLVQRHMLRNETLDTSTPCFKRTNV